MGLLSKFDHRRLMSSQNFLLRVRNEMHFHANETNDALSRAEQLRLADYLKYQGKQGMRPVEQFGEVCASATADVKRVGAVHTAPVASAPFRTSARRDSRRSSPMPYPRAVHPPKAWHGGS